MKDDWQRSSLSPKDLKNLQVAKEIALWMQKSYF
jgi:hypothetical protein